MDHDHERSGAAPAADPTTRRVIADLKRQRGRMTRWTRAIMVAEAVALLLLGAGAAWALMTTGEPTVLTVGFRLGPAAAAALIVTALAIAAATPWPHAALRRVALSIAIVFTAAFVAGGVFYPGVDTIWETNAATAALLAGVALAGFCEFVLLNADVFDPEPGSLP